MDQEALIEALKDRRLRAAYLDVTDPEPLPPGHALWTAPNCFITPHVAAAHEAIHAHLVEHFLMNFERFVNGEELVDRVI